MKKYLFGLLVLAFCFSLSVDVGAVEQPIKTEFVTPEAPAPVCDAHVLDFVSVPSFQDPLPLTSYQPASRHGNPERLCGYLENVITIDQSLRFEATSIERYRPRTDMSSASVSAKEPDDNCLSDFKVG